MIAAGGDGAFRRGTSARLSLDSLILCGEALHSVYCGGLPLAIDVPHGAGERPPAFTQEELEKLVEGVLPLYGRLYGQPEVSAHQKRAHWHAIAKEVRTLGVYNWRSTHCRKRWEVLRRWVRKISEAQLGKSSQRGRGARRALTPLMRRILVVAYPTWMGW
ncbi:hypothetical protein NDU88_009323 [Pleurodeles waltl]|uniref:Myb/SANT-like DNA-binding domain-containing protein n=1 Tax=Pleurodeles waltl TaxID=8319 RepID=A0AAV7S052_PLEWA|nr:hypothetical protein NDU88_009323 [Pleurodeles waltl]